MGKRWLMNKSTAPDSVVRPVSVLMLEKLAALCLSVYRRKSKKLEANSQQEDGWFIHGFVGFLMVCQRIQIQTALIL